MTIKQRMREADILRVIPRHSNVVNFFEYRIDETDFWMFLERCDGDLNDYCKNAIYNETVSH